MQPLFSSILHPTDFSTEGHEAFAQALAIAVIWQAEFRILHIGPEKANAVAWDRFPAVRNTLERWGLLDPSSPQSAVFEQLKVDVSKVAVRGRLPVLSTDAFLAQQPTDLIVLATQGREGISRWINPSDAEAIARWSKTKTLFVPVSAERTLVSPVDGQLTLKNVLVPVDRTPDCTAAVRYAQRVASILGGSGVEVTLLSIGEHPPTLPERSSGDERRWRFIQRQGNPASEILAVAQELQAELIVMATAGHQSILDALRGSTTEQVLRRSPCPLLAVPSGSTG